MPPEEDPLPNEPHDERAEYSSTPLDEAAAGLAGAVLAALPGVSTVVFFGLDGSHRLIGRAVVRRAAAAEEIRSDERRIRRLRWSVQERAWAPVRALAPAEDAGPPTIPNDLLQWDAVWDFRLVSGSMGPLGVLGLGGDAPSARLEDVPPWESAARRLEHVALRDAALRASQDLQTVHDAATTVLSSTNLEDLLTAISRLAARALGASWSSIWIVQGDETELAPVATSGSAFDATGTRGQLLGLAQTCAQNHRAIRLDETETRERVGTPSLGAIVMVPLVAFEQTLGVLALGRTAPVRAQRAVRRLEFEARDEALLLTIAAQCSVAVRTAQLQRDVRQAERRLREAQSHLLQTEKLAALGEMSAKVAHEIRNPLSAVGGFARRIQKALSRDDPNARYADLIVKETERLEGILTEQLEFARTSRPRLQPLDLNEVLRETLVLVREEADRKGVRVLEDLAANLPPVMLDRDKLEQVFLNILRNALEASGDGNRIQVRTARHGGDVRAEIANDGAPLPGEALESLFVPFATTRPGGTGLGLAVARQIVQDHGGEIHVRTGQSWSVVFTVSFPIRDNQDRRRLARERRGARDRRRAA